MAISPDYADFVSDWHIRAAEPSDVADVLAMIHELAVYEREPDAVKTTAADLHRDLFTGAASPHGAPAIYCDVAVSRDQPNELFGMALWFLSYSTWEGTHGIYLEDLYVRPPARGKGIGKALIAGLAQRCVARGFARLEWSVLDWNTPAIGFYRSIGAVGMDEWTVQRLTGPALAELGGSS
jgi:GNAT superfamily N-acetyltransferase